MLKAVVEKKYVDGLLRLDALTFREAILADSKGGAALEAELHQLDFVAGAIDAPVATAEDGDALPFRKKSLGKPNHHRRFAGAANRQVSDAHHRGLQAFLLQQTFGIEPDAQPNECAIEQRQRPEQHPHQRNVHRAAPLMSFAISASARSVAPRLVSTRLCAEALIFFARSGSRKISIQATPTSSGLSTCTAAPAETKREAISAKFSIEGPNTGIFPKAAGSRILCPPDGTNEPPTNTPSATR